VGMLSRLTNEADVQAMFAPYGTIQEVFVMRDADGKAKGSAFVKFSTLAEANNAIAMLDQKIRDKDAPSNIQVRFAQSAKDKQAPAAAPYGAMGVMGTGFDAYQQMMMNQMLGMQGMLPPTSQPGFPQYDPATAYNYAAMGYGAPQVPGYGFTQPAAPKMAAPKQQYGQDGCNLFVYNIPESFTDEMMVAMFATYGNVLSANVQKDLATGRPKGFGFVSYENPGSAQASIKGLDNQMVMGKKLSVRLKGQRAAGGGARAAPY